MIILRREAKDAVLIAECRLCGTSLGDGPEQTKVGGSLCHSTGTKPEDARGPVCVTCVGLCEDYVNAKNTARGDDQEAKKRVRDAIRTLTAVTEATAHTLSSRARYLANFGKLHLTGDLAVK